MAYLVLRLVPFEQVWAFSLTSATAFAILPVNALLTD
jgi:hypothetical protein